MRTSRTAAVAGLVVAAALTAGTALPGLAADSASDSRVPATEAQAAAVSEALAQQDAALAAARAAALRAQQAAARAAVRAVVARPVARPAVKVAAKPAVRRVVKAAAKPVAKPVAAVVETAAQRGQRVLASLHYDWQALGYRFVFLPGQKGLLGMTSGADKTVTIYVRSTQSDLILAHTIAHELGHVLDFTRGTADRRSAYLRIRGLNPNLAWFGCSGCTDYATPAGDWAEVFAYYLAGPGDFRSQMQSAPTAGQLLQLGALFRS
jgi:hypothetical protein